MKTFGDYTIDSLQKSDCSFLVQQNCAIFPHLVDSIKEDFTTTNPDIHYFVLRHKENPVGNIGLTKFGEAYEAAGMNPDDWALGYFQIQPPHRGKGFGKILMAMVEELARSKGIKRLWIDTTDREDQKVAYHLYTKIFDYRLHSTHPLPVFDCTLHLLFKDLV